MARKTPKNETTPQSAELPAAAPSARLKIKPPVGPCQHALASCEVAVPKEWSVGTRPGKERQGECFRAALSYVFRHEIPGLVLVHGTIEQPVGRIEHAWVELPGDIVFDGVAQRFYRRDGYYATMGAIKNHAYTPVQAGKLGGLTSVYGPWTDDERSAVELPPPVGNHEGTPAPPGETTP
jgi:hypothetical protein